MPNQLLYHSNNYCIMAYIDRINPNIMLGRLLYADDGTKLKYPNSPQSEIPLERKTQVLFDYLKQNGCIESFIRRMKHGLGNIERSNAARNLHKYNELIEKDKFNVSIYHRWIAFDYYDILPAGPKLIMTDYDNLSPIYRNLVDGGMKSALQSAVRESTISAEASNLSSFLLYLQRNGTYSMEDLHETAVRNYLQTGRCQSYTLYRTGLFLKRHASLTGNARLMSVIPFFPKERASGKVYEAFTNNERSVLEAFITGHGCPLSKRDRAITALLLYTGMRASDISNLKLGDIDWHKSRIRFRQGKTGTEVLLPLRPFAGNCLYDYIHNERGNSDDPRCFISPLQWGSTQCGCNVCSVINSVYAKAGLRQGNVRKGSHLLRHSFADEMMNNGADISVVAKTLGHTHPDTTLGYLSSNIEQLRSCALSIEHLPVKHNLY